MFRDDKSILKSVGPFWNFSDRSDMATCSQNLRKSLFSSAIANWAYRLLDSRGFFDSRTLDLGFLREGAVVINYFLADGFPLGITVTGEN